MDIKQFLQYLRYEKRFSPHTILAYQRDLEQFSTYLKETYETEDVAAVSFSMVRSWIVNLMEKEISSRSVNRKISTLKSQISRFQIELHCGGDACSYSAVGCSSGAAD